MPIEFDGNPPDETSLARLDHFPATHGDDAEATAAGHLDIAILNNMPDAALQATERQFAGLLRGAAGRREIRLKFFSLPEVARGPEAGARIAASYLPIAELAGRRFDGLIVTGTEPRAALLVDEPYWQSLTGIVDWAEHNTIATIWSCLAAHAAVLHLDGITRRPFAEKCSGVFECVRDLDDPILAGAPSPMLMPHSRWNDLRESDLVAHGYRVLTRSEAGVDLFAKQWRSLFLFLQGHPEYEAASLLLEYRRDVGRYLRGEREIYPTMPASYFDGRGEEALADFAGRAAKTRRPELLANFPKDAAPHAVTASRWQASAKALVGNWLDFIAARKSETAR